MREKAATFLTWINSLKAQESRDPQRVHPAALRERIRDLESHLEEACEVLRAIAAKPT